MNPTILLASHDAPSSILTPGSTLSLIEQALYLSQQGYHVIFSCPPINTPRQEVIDLLERNGIKTITIATPPWSQDARYQHAGDSSLDASEAVKDYLGVIHGHNVDIVLTNTALFPWAAIAAAIAGVPHIWSIHEYASTSFGTDWLSQCYPFIAASSNLILASSTLLKQSIEFTLHTSPAPDDVRIDVVTPWTDVSAIRLSDDVSCAPRLVCPNSFTPFKNQLELLTAVRCLRDTGRLIDTYFSADQTGDREYYEAARRFVDNSGLAPSVSFNKTPGVGNWDRVKSTDIIMHTSTIESFGLTISETLRLGLPLIVTEEASEPIRLIQPKLIDKRGVYPSGDIQALVRAILTYVDDSSRIRDRATKMVPLATSLFSREVCMGELESAIISVFEEGSPLAHLSTSQICHLALSDLDEKNNE